MKSKKLVSVAIVLAMLLSLFSMSVFADGNEAKIDDTEYATLEAAVAVAEKGDTIVLLDDITYGTDHSVAIWELKEFDLDLNGHTFTTNSTQGIAIKNEGYKTSAICFGETVANTPHRDITVSNGTVRSDYGAGIYVDGDVTMTLSGLDVKQIVGEIPTGHDVEYMSAIRTTTNAVVTVEDGRYEGLNAIAVSNSGGNVTVNGGTFVGNIYFSASGTTANKTITINGGNFTGNFVNANKGIITITGGTFDTDPSAYVAEGYKAVNNGNGTYTVESRYVAQIGETKYETLAGAIAAANEIGNVTVTLLKDYDMEANEPGYGYSTYYLGQGETTLRDNKLEISGSNIVFDLNDHTISDIFNNTFTVTGENVTIKNGTMVIGQVYYGYYNNGPHYYDAPRYASYPIFVDHATNLIIDDLTTTGGINVAGGSTATINDLAFSGTCYYAICSQENSVVNLTGGTYDKATNGAANYLFWVEAGSVMNITGGNYYTGDATFCDIDATSVAPVISGGTFDFDPTAYLAADYTAVNNGDGTWTVNSDYAAKIGDVKYATLEDAVEAAQDGDTIVLLSDITYGEDHEVAVWEKGFNLDLNGHIFTTNSNQSITASNNGYKATAICYGVSNPHEDISVSNGTIRTAYGAGIYAAGDVTMTLSGLDVKQNYPTNVQTTDEYSSAIRLTTNATVIIEDGSYAGKNAIAVSNSGGNVTVNGGTFVGDIYFSKAGTTANKTITINGGNFTRNSTNDELFVNTNKGKLTIYGGTFDADPSAYVADGYEAVYNGDGTWTVGEVKASAPEIEATTEGYYVTYTVKRQVVDANDDVINEGNSRTTVNIKAATEDTVHEAETAEEFFENFDMNKVLDSVVASADAGDTVNVEIKVVCDNPEVVNETITYEVHPEAIITVNDNPSETVRISNDALDENAVFTIRLDVPNAVAAAAITTGNIKVVHRSVGYEDETNVYPLQGDLNNYYVEFNVTHFSEFIVAANGSLFSGHSVTLNGYINLNFYLDLYENQVTTGTGTVVNFTWDEGSDSYTVTTADYVEGKGYKATVKLPAAEMTYGITASVVINDVEQAETNTYSVRQYADELLAIADPVDDAKLINLINAMLDYGAKAQLAFGSNVDSLANEGISYYMPYYYRYELLDMIDLAISNANNGSRATVMRDFAEGIGADAYYSSSLVYLSGCTLRHYFVFAGGAPNAEDFTGVKSDYYYYVDVTDIAAADLDKLQSFPVGGNTCFYSALDFVKAIIYNYDEESSYYNLAAATYWYNQAANAYFD